MSEPRKIEFIERPGPEIQVLAVDGLTDKFVRVVDIKKDDVLTVDPFGDGWAEAKVMQITKAPLDPIFCPDFLVTTFRLGLLGEDGLVKDQREFSSDPEYMKFVRRP